MDADAPAHFGWSALAPAPAPDLADSFLPTGEGSASISPAAHGAPVVQPPTLTQPVGAAASCGSDGAARAGEGCSLAARAGEAAECEGEDAAAEPATAAGVSLSPQRSRSGSRPGSSVAVVAIHGAAAADGAASDQHAQVPGRASLTSGHAGRAAAVQPPSHSASPRGNSMSSTAPAGCPASTADAAEDAAGQVPAASAGPAAAVAVAAGTSIPANPVLGGPASRPSDSSNGQPSAMAGLPKRSPATEVPSPAALFAAMQAGKAASKAVPSTAAAAAFGMAHLQQPAGSAAVGPASPAVARTVSSSVPAAEQQVAATAGAACEPAPGGAAPPASSTDAEPAAGVGPAEVEAAAQDSMRQKTGGAELAFKCRHLGTSTAFPTHARHPLDCPPVLAHPLILQERAPGCWRWLTCCASAPPSSPAACCEAVACGAGCLAPPLKCRAAPHRVWLWCAGVTSGPVLVLLLGRHANAPTICFVSMPRWKLQASLAEAVAEQERLKG